MTTFLEEFFYDNIFTETNDSTMMSHRKIYILLCFYARILKDNHVALDKVQRLSNA